MRSSFLRFVSFALTAGATVLSPAMASADGSCTVDADCMHGFACQVTAGTTACASSCPPNADCFVPSCAPTSIKSCVPGACQTSADCATDMACQATTTSSCTGGADVACDGGKCGAVTTTCTTQTVHSCVPRYLLDCTVDSDCGSGFSCTPQVACACGGGSIASAVDGSTGSGSSSSTAYTIAPSKPPPDAPSPAEDAGVEIVVDAGAAFADGGVDFVGDAGVGFAIDAGGGVAAADGAAGCSCGPTGVSSCVPKSIACAADGDCPSRWTCQLNSTGATCGSAGASVDGGVAIPVDCNITPVTMGQCEPPYWNTPLSGGSTAGALLSSSNPSAPPRSDEGSHGDTSTTTAPGAALDAGSASSGSPNSESSPPDSTGHVAATSPKGPSDNGGCHVATGTGNLAGGAFEWLLALAGAVAMRRRRV